MMNKVISNCDLLCSNVQTIKRVFKWESEYMTTAAASLLASQGVMADENKLNICHKIIKDNTSWLSIFRSSCKISLAAKMCMSDDPVMYFKKVKTIYAKVSGKKIFENDYNVIASMILADQVDDNMVDNYVSRTNEIYNAMRKEHSILTSSEDIPFATILALSDKGIGEMISDMEESYKILSKQFMDKNAVQSLSHVLTIIPQTPEVKCAKVMELYNGLKAAGHKYGSSHELCLLGACLTLNISNDVIVDYICKADDLLAGRKGFGNFSFGKEERRMIATQMVINCFGDKDNLAATAALNTLCASVIDIEVCMILCAIAAANAANSSNTAAMTCIL